MKKFDNEDDFEMDDDEIDFEFDYPEDYESEEDDEEMFQKKMRMKNIQKGLKQSASASGKWVDEPPFNPIKPSDLPLEKYMEKKKTIKMKESDLINIVKKVLKEQEETTNYMFFSNLEQIKRQCEKLLQLDPKLVDKILNDGHDWADDHVTEAKTNMDQVFDFMMNESKKMESYIEFEDINEATKKKTKKNVPTNPSLWKKSLAWAKSRYKVCPSAYCNGAAAKHYKSLGGKWKKK